MRPRPCSVCPQVGWEMCFVPWRPRRTSVLFHRGWQKHSCVAGWGGQEPNVSSG